MRFDQKLMNYAISEELTSRKIVNCRKAIEKQFPEGVTMLQLITIQSILRTMKKRIEKNYADLLECFNYYLGDLLEIKIR